MFNRCPDAPNWQLLEQHVPRRAGGQRRYIPSNQPRLSQRRLDRVSLIIPMFSLEVSFWRQVLLEPAPGKRQQQSRASKQGGFGVLTVTPPPGAMSGALPSATPS